MSERKCSECEHPMMSGPIQPKRGSGDFRTADWYCANCHHVIWHELPGTVVPNEDGSEYEVV